jgi:tRNA(Ile)-lysidine synthase
VAGVSGGADSMALLVLLALLRPEFSWDLIVVHVHHGLRGEAADQDAAFVEEWAGRLGARFVLKTVEVTPGRGQSLEMAARDARRRALLDVAEPLDARIVLAHQAEDQAETVLLRLIRGTGVAGLAAMRPVSGRIVRPLLGYRRAELTRLLEDQGVPWREDATNQDRAILRNRVRHDVLPLLRSLNPRVDEAFRRLAQSAAELDAWADHEARRWYGAHAHRDLAAGELRLLGLRGVPRALAERALRLAAADLGLSVTEEQVDRAMDGATVWPRHHTVEWQDRDVVIGSPVAPPVWPPDPIPVAADGVTALPRGRLVVRPAGFGEVGLVWPSGGLYARAWRPGDRIELAGLGQKKLQDVFVDRKVPRALRHAWPVLVTAPEAPTVVAVPGLAVGASHQAARGGVVVIWERDGGPDASAPG